MSALEKLLFAVATLAFFVAVGLMFFQQPQNIRSVPFGLSVLGGLAFLLKFVFDRTCSREICFYDAKLDVFYLSTLSAVLLLLAVLLGRNISLDALPLVSPDTLIDFGNYSMKLNTFVVLSFLLANATVVFLMWKFRRQYLSFVSLYQNNDVPIFQQLIFFFTNSIIILFSVFAWVAYILVTYAMGV